MIASLNKAFLDASWMDVSPTFIAGVIVCYVGLKSPRFKGPISEIKDGLLSS